VTTPSQEFVPMALETRARNDLRVAGRRWKHAPAKAQINKLLAEANKPDFAKKCRSVRVVIRRGQAMNDSKALQKTDPALIPALIGEGLSDAEIASRMGWTIGTLRVRCCQLKISLRRSNASQRQIVLPQSIFDQLHQRAAIMGVATSVLALELLTAIARDDLYKAVLGEDSHWGT
jgi:hypothetical protein